MGVEGSSTLFWYQVRQNSSIFPPMNYPAALHTVLQQYQVDPHRGFLPGEDPLLQLPAYYRAWEELGGELTAYLNAGVIRKQLEAMPLLSTDQLTDKRQLERAMLLLSFFGHAYIHCGPETTDQLPASVSVPWVAVSTKLGRLPILAHASLALNNWRRLDASQPIQLDNVTTQLQFHGGIDEAWFYLVTTYIEGVGAKGILPMLAALTAAEAAQFDEVKTHLQTVVSVLKDMNKALLSMYDHVDPHIFYMRVRPFLASFEGIQYEGVAPRVRHYHGGSAAQSSLIQFYDAALGLQYDHHPRTQEYLQLMRNYMPPEHAKFLRHIESVSLLRKQSGEEPALREVYQAVVDELIQFRNEHLKMVALYIMKQAATQGEDAQGTGGTNPMKFLKSIRNSNQASREP